MSGNNGSATDEQQEYDAVNKEPGNLPKEVPVFTNEDDLEREFRSIEQTDNARLLVKPGDDITELMMRANIPNMKINLCVNMNLQRLRDHKCESKIDFWKGLLAGSTGVRGSRAQLFSDTIIGEKHSANREGFVDKLKKWAQPGE